MNNILIVTTETKGNKTEEIYFINKDNRGSSSLKRDKEFLKRLNLKDVFYLSFNISANSNKIKKSLNPLKKIKPNIYECFVFCDRDKDSYSDEQIEKKFDLISKILEEKLLIDKSNIHYLKYKNEYQKFEDFLACHIERKDKKEFIKNFNKTDKDLYNKTMGKNGKNLNIFIKNLYSIDFYDKFNHLFKRRPDVEFD